MARYIKKIEAEAAIVCLFPDMPRIKFNGNHRRWREENEQYLQCLDAIHSIPTADVRENVKAHWIHERLVSTGGGSYPVVRCSACQWQYPMSETRFCPNCGAVMDGKERK